MLLSAVTGPSLLLLAISAPLVSTISAEDKRYWDIYLAIKYELQTGDDPIYELPSVKVTNPFNDPWAKGEALCFAFDTSEKLRRCLKSLRRSFYLIFGYKGCFEDFALPTEVTFSSHSFAEEYHNIFELIKQVFGTAMKSAVEKQLNEVDWSVFEPFSPLFSYQGKKTKMSESSRELSRLDRYNIACVAKRCTAGMEKLFEISGRGQSMILAKWLVENTDPSPNSGDSDSDSDGDDDDDDSPTSASKNQSKKVSKNQPSPQSSLKDQQSITRSNKKGKASSKSKEPIESSDSDNDGKRKVKKSSSRKKHDFSPVASLLKEDQTEKKKKESKQPLKSHNSSPKGLVEEEKGNHSKKISMAKASLEKKINHRHNSSSTSSPSQQQQVPETLDSVRSKKRRALLAHLTLEEIQAIAQGFISPSALPKKNLSDYKNFPLSSEGEAGKIFWYYQGQIFYNLLGALSDFADEWVDKAIKNKEEKVRGKSKNVVKSKDDNGGPEGIEFWVKELSPVRVYLQDAYLMAGLQNLFNLSIKDLLFKQRLFKLELRRVLAGNSQKLSNEAFTFLKKIIYNTNLESPFKLPELKSIIDERNSSEIIMAAFVSSPLSTMLNQGFSKWVGLMHQVALKDKGFPAEFQPEKCFELYELAIKERSEVSLGSTQDCYRTIFEYISDKESHPNPPRK